MGHDKGRVWTTNTPSSTQLIHQPHKQPPAPLWHGIVFKKQTANSRKPLFHPLDGEMSGNGAVGAVPPYCLHCALYCSFPTDFTMVSGREDDDGRGQKTSHPEQKERVTERLRDSLENGKKSSGEMRL